MLKCKRCDKETVLAHNETGTCPPCSRQLLKAGVLKKCVQCERTTPELHGKHKNMCIFCHSSVGQSMSSLPTGKVCSSCGGVPKTTKLDPESGLCIVCRAMKDGRAVGIGIRAVPNLALTEINIGINACIDEGAPFSVTFGETKIESPEMVGAEHPTGERMRSFVILQFADRRKPSIVLDSEDLPVTFKDEGAAEAFGDFWEHGPDGVEDWKVIAY